MSIGIVIPARLASTRLPEKMLLNETGWPLIRHVYEQAKKSKKADRVLIATEDPRIATAIEVFGGSYVMTSPHPTGTDKLAEVAEKHLTNAQMIINVQGDEPEIEPEKIDHLIDLFSATQAEVGTLVTPFPSDRTEGPGSPLDPNCVKAVLGAPVRKTGEQTILGYQALYFSRSLIPYPREQVGKIVDASKYYMHLGIYAYRPAFLQKYVKLKQGQLEITEKLEQLRVLENGFQIVAGVVPSATPGIDTRADYDAFVQRWKSKKASS